MNDELDNFLSDLREYLKAGAGKVVGPHGPPDDSYYLMDPRYLVPWLAGRREMRAEDARAEIDRMMGLLGIPLIEIPFGSSSTGRSRSVTRYEWRVPVAVLQL